MCKTRPKIRICYLLEIQKNTNKPKEKMGIWRKSVSRNFKEHDVDEKELHALYLVENHEDGGDEEANIIRDADSLSYFEDNFDGYLKECGVERAKRKVEYMFGRMSENGKSWDWSFIMRR